MGLLRKLKSLFIREITSNTSIIQNDRHIRSYNELSAKEKIQVANEIDKLVTFDFGDIITYTKDQDIRINYIQDYIINSKNGSNDDDDKITRLAKIINSLLIYSGECEILKEELEQIKTVLEIKYHALNIILENPMQVLKKKNEILWYNEQQNHLIEERKLISQSIENTFFSIESTKRRIADSLKVNQNQTESVSDELYQQTLDILGDEIYNNLWHLKGFLPEVIEKVINKIERLNEPFNQILLNKIQAYLKENNPRLMKRINSVDSLQPDDKLYKKCFIEFLSHRNDTNAWNYLVHQLPDDLVKELYKIVAKYVHQIRINTFNHRNDYKIYLKEVEDLTNKCFSTPVENWRSSNISPYSAMLQFSGNGIQYSHMCRNYLTDEIREQMREAFAKLNWLSNIGCGLCGADPGNYLDEPDANLWDEKAVQEYFNRFNNELLAKIEEKFSINLKEINFLSGVHNWRLTFTGYCRDLVNLLNNCYDTTMYVFPTKEHPINQRHSSTITSLNDEPIPIEDFYYYLRAKEGMNPEIDFRKLAPFYSDKTDLQRYNGSPTTPSIFDNLVAVIRLKQLEDQYDDRILIAPAISDDSKRDKSDYRKKLNAASANNFEGILINDLYKLSFIFNYSKKTYSNHTKFLFVTKSLKEKLISDSTSCLITIREFILESIFIDIKYELGISNSISYEIKNFYQLMIEADENSFTYKGLKIITIPNDTTYSELSDILNQEIAKSMNGKHMEKIAQ